MKTLQRTTACTLTVICLCIGMTAYAQTLTQRVILQNGPDSLIQKSFLSYFDKEGNYCFVVKKDKKQFYIFTTHDTLGPFCNAGYSYSKDGGIVYARKPSEQSDGPLYYMSYRGTKVYGPAVGEIQWWVADSECGGVALTTLSNDTVHRYLNCHELLRCHRSEMTKEMDITLEKWAAFSQSGHALYSVKKDSLYRIYVDGRVVDSAAFKYIELAINNNGDYIFAEGFRPQQPIGRYDYLFYVHANEASFDKVRTVWYHTLREDGGFYYSGDDNGPDYILVNGDLYRDMDETSNFRLYDKDNYLFTYRKNRHNWLNVNGKIYPLKFKEAMSPSMDEHGNFALYGKKGGRIYKYVNGEKSSKPLSKYGVRATPLYISPKGESLHYFKTKGSLYLYRDETLVLPPLSAKERFKIHSSYSLFYQYPFDGNPHTLLFMRYGQNSYWVFDGQLSPPLPMTDPDFCRNSESYPEIISGAIIGDEFYAILQVGDRSYCVVMNNRIYPIDGKIDKILRHCDSFDGKQLVFYGIKENAYYQFIVK